MPPAGGKLCEAFYKYNLLVPLKIEKKGASHEKRLLPLLLCGALVLSGCGLLRREYTRTEPHSATYYEGDRRDVLRAEGRQDLVNDLLLLVSAHDESGTVWLYDSEDGADASQLAQVACDEVLQETPLGAYALEYLTYTVDEGGRGYTQLRFTAGYRRTAQQIKSIVHATNAAALRDLLQAAVENGGKELAVQVGSFDSSRQSVLDSVAALQQELGHGNQSWQVQFYPDTDAWGIMEIILKE